ncbi:hypothetical protein ESY86_07905 [Subsaximicrobium wynnwilliamsii]|jgi:hypothetical protein|uniref:Capsule polysaccharide biosynthesis protein n=1 Tax=Subsaximicrobium wynnwilliamsii TaxID=291179 RepID=A0A5C6ZKK4_9FLAO|nr:hypothetical protein [Subsaximicrobium wynnwilliamsii]TXD83955.1 hypothetical protein ESY87_08070 [Subsaximicrobium wynnwilliamsii]TXD89695.1 hypothetical protein ESY86_07905 [Subsaximicrobium wynnwilliamsii]TXE01680.1 hypothetical protein ESY88_14970 [Subsaximicrobium wynnwilliamsii]
MKLLFIENRYKTFLLDAVAKELSQTHDIYWLVQNHSFKPSYGDSYILPYPSAKQLKRVHINYDIDYDQIIQSDRQINFFEKTDTSYLYYYANQIGEQLLKLKPDFVFGEATAFHELLTIELCKKFDIQYLNPTTCRYPTGRFSFYNYASLDPYKGSDESLERATALELIKSITTRTIKPDYMKNAAISKEGSFKDKLKIMKSYYVGERFNTPSPIVKLKLERFRNDSIKRWYTFAKPSIDASKTAILFPMHMQPESNIDVWGRDYRDQFDTVKQIHSNLLNGQILYVKPNPKSKYELSTELMDFIEAHENVTALRHDVSMVEIFEDIDLVTTITGTIAIECILANKPVVTFVRTINNKAANCLYIESFDDLKAVFKLIETKSFPSICEDEKIEFLNMLNRLSFAGVISDPYHNPNCVSQENINSIKNAFESVISIA